MVHAAWLEAHGSRLMAHRSWFMAKGAGRAPRPGGALGPGADLGACPQAPGPGHPPLAKLGHEP